MKKEGEFLPGVSQSIYVRGLSREWRGFAQVWYKSSCPESLFQGLLLSVTCTRHCKENLWSAYSLCKLCPVFFFFFWTTVGETWAILAFLRASLTEWNRLASSLKPWACRQFLSSVSAVKVSSVKCSWVLATRMIQPLSLSNSFTVNSEILSTYDVPLVQLNFDSIHVVLMGTWPGICREHLLYIWKKTPLLF